MAAVHSLRVSVKSDSGSDRSEAESDAESDKDSRRSEPMEVEEGELDADDITVNRSLKELIPDTTRRYENKAGTFITGIDVNSKEAIEKKEKRAQRFHFSPEVRQGQRNLVLDKETLIKAVPQARLEAIYVIGVDDMSTQDIFGYFKEYPPAHIEWIDDTSCNVVWLDDITSFRVLINASLMPDPEAVTTETEADVQPDKPTHPSRARRSPGTDDAEEEENEEEEGEVNEGEKVAVKADAEERPAEQEKKPEADVRQVEQLSQAERESLLRNDLRPAIKPFKGNKLLLRFATHDDKKELGAARRSRYYMKYGNPNYGGMKGILSNSWKRRYHTRRIQRDVIKSKKPIIGDSMGHTPPYTHRHSADLVNLPEEPIKEEEEEEEEEEDPAGEEDMDSDDRVVEYRAGAGGRAGPAVGGGVRARIGICRGPPSAGSSDSDEMDYDLELKMISTPSPKKSMKMTMYADELETKLQTIRNSVSSHSGSGSGVQNRIGDGGSQSEPKSPAAGKVRDIRQLLEEKRQGHRTAAPLATAGKMDVRQRLGKRRRSPSPVSPRDSPPPLREPIRDVHSRLGVASQDARAQFATLSKDGKTSRLWSRLGPSKAGLHDKGKEEHQVEEEEEDDDEEEEGSRSRSGGRRGGSGVFSSSRLGTLPDDDHHHNNGGADNGSSRKPRRGSSGRGGGGGKQGGAGEGSGPEEEDDQALQKVWGAMIKQKQEQQQQQSHRGKKSRLENLPSLQIEISRDSDSPASDSDS